MQQKEQCYTIRSLDTHTILCSYLQYVFFLDSLDTTMKKLSSPRVREQLL